MKTHIFEAHSDEGNWGKFLVGVFDDAEWSVRSQVETVRASSGHLLAPDVVADPQPPLLTLIGWNPRMVWVLDLQTREGAAFLPGGYHVADLMKHRIWVCPLFEPFLGWLYQQDMTRLHELPRLVQLTGVPLQFSGYRRPGPPEARR